MEKLGIDNIRIHAGPFSDLNTINPDVIYVDPDRRTQSDSQGRNIEQYEPNILEHLDVWLSLSSTVMIKLSPVTDITWIRKKNILIGGIQKITYLLIDNASYNLMSLTPTR